jgi:hypothetical protein
MPNIPGSLQVLPFMRLKIEPGCRWMRVSELALPHQFDELAVLGSRCAAG